MGDAIKLEFDRVRKLKVQHKYLREAVRSSGKGVQELLNDPFGGYPFLLQALLAPSASSNETITLDKASAYIDTFLEKGGTMEMLFEALVQTLSAYMHVENTPTRTEMKQDPPPNADSPGEPGPSDD